MLDCLSLPKNPIREFLFFLFYRYWDPEEFGNCTNLWNKIWTSYLLELKEATMRGTGLKKNDKTHEANQENVVKV